MANPLSVTKGIRWKECWSTWRGDSIDDLLKEFPDLEKEDFQACLQYAVLNMKHKYAEINAS